MSIKTKFGNVGIDDNGYYRITSIKEDNFGKRLHRLIWEDFYGCEVPEGYVIHHRNFNKLDNCILNLQLMRKKEHDKLHHIGKTLSCETKKKLSEANSSENHPNYGKNLSDETKYKISVAQNSSGYMNVIKQKSKSCKQGFVWRYQYYEDGKRKYIVAVDIGDLKAKVKAKGLKWRKIV